eukprot:jgi/Mesvir1/18114/Mv09411-RA.1
MEVDQGEIINPNPVIFERKATARDLQRRTANDADEYSADAIDSLEHIRDITDPEHPYTLEQLHVVSEEAIDVDDEKGLVKVVFTPTVKHCSMATLIGLCIRVKLLHALPPRFKVDIMLAKDSHSSEAQVNKQLNDKERVAAAIENPHLQETVAKCLASTERVY